jgi:tetratricopeptide (TPR) repeat protein
MADQGRLEELKRKFDDNPRRYFAPLANEYRKAGEPDVAIELCRTYLPQQPNHMSGYIVYGQALQDAGQIDESAAVFKQALTLDPENIIALRTLGDIARDSGDDAAAMTWYGKVLEMDPRNEEIAAYIASITNPHDQPAPARPERQAPPTVRPEPEPDESAVRLEDIVSQPDMVQMPLSADEGPAVPPDAGLEFPESPVLDQAEQLGEFGQPGDAGQLGDSDVLIDWPTSEDEDAPVEPFEVTQWPSAADAAASDAESAAASSMDEPATPVLEGPWHSAAEPLAEPPAEPPAEPTTGQIPVPDATAEPVAPSAEPQAPVTPSHADSPFVTETMAELYMQQGLRGEALGIYRQLALKRDDPEIQKRIADLEAETAPAAHRETAREFFARIGKVRPAEKVAIAGGAKSPLATLFESIPPAPGDVAAAERLSGAFGSTRRDSSRD